MEVWFGRIDSPSVEANEDPDGNYECDDNAEDDNYDVQYAPVCEKYQVVK